MQTDILFTPLRIIELETLILNQVRIALSEINTTPLSAVPVEDELLTIDKAAALLSVSVPTIYGYVHQRNIPSMKRRGRLYFSKFELLAWVQTGRRSTMDEIKANALKSLVK